MCLHTSQNTPPGFSHSYLPSSGGNSATVGHSYSTGISQPHPANLIRRKKTKAMALEPLVTDRTLVFMQLGYCWVKWQTGSVLPAVAKHCLTASQWQSHLDLKAEALWSAQIQGREGNDWNWKATCTYLNPIHDCSQFSLIFHIPHKPRSYFCTSKKDSHSPDGSPNSLFARLI